MRRHQSVDARVADTNLHACFSSEATRLTGDEKHDSCSKGAVEPFKGVEVSKGHAPRDDAREARHG